jgi:plasmid maintenance system antidote protein VapI
MLLCHDFFAIYSKRICKNTPALSEAFGNTAQFWVNLQKNYELHAEKKVNRKKIKHFIAA